MNALGALKVASAQLQLDAITGGCAGHGQAQNLTGDVDSEWDDWQGMGTQTSRREALQPGQSTTTARSNGGAAPCQTAADPSHEDPTAALLSGMLLQQLSVRFLP